MKEWERKRKRGKCHEIKDFLGYITVKLSFLFPIYLSTLPSPHSLFSFLPRTQAHWLSHRVFIHRKIYILLRLLLSCFSHVHRLVWLIVLNFCFIQSEKFDPRYQCAHICIHIFISHARVAAVDKIYIVRKRCEKREEGRKGGRDSVKQASQQAS